MKLVHVLQCMLLVGCLFSTSFGWNPNPVANPKAVVTAGKARFIVLTPQLIRMEYSGQGVFRDNATFSVLNRALTVPTFTQSTVNGVLNITTSALTLTYQVNSGPFTKTNLQIVFRLNGNTVKWDMGAAPTGNLLGTVRTLDTINGAYPLYCPTMNPPMLYDSHCTLAPISRDGWAVYNDSLSPIWDGSAWPWYSTWEQGQGSCAIEDDQKQDCMFGDQASCLAAGCCYNNSVGQASRIPYCYWTTQQSFTYQDYYFYGYGHNYVQAMTDFVSIAGPIPALPRYIFGPQYSRWHAFNEQDEVTIIEEGYEAAGVPLDVLVIDMDWHTTYYSKPPTCNTKSFDGWTGYTWDKGLFPNPERFLEWVHSKGLHVTNNMHPAAGVQCSEDTYNQFALAMGVDPRSNVTIPYDLQNKTYAQNFMKIVLQPLTNQGADMNGIDYWWIDYQQGEALVAPGVNPTYWVNYVFSSSTAWWGSNIRPVIMARWGGLGNHRFSDIGFSGDTATSWESLAFQPYFTATAANVGFFWSHDLGGFNGQPDPELFVRWIQWGAFSNMLRTHCDGKRQGGGFTRDIWEYPYYYYSIMRDAFQLRSKLVPYIYSNHFAAHLTGVNLLHPMYYAYPEENGAYTYTNQYMYGADMWVSPVVAPATSHNLTQVALWVPPTGAWVEYESGWMSQGGAQNRTYALGEIPVFVRAGAIIPTRATYATPVLGSAQQVPSVLRFEVYAPAIGVNGATTVYEDDGATTDYDTKNAYASTSVTMKADTQSAVFVINAMSGGYNGMPKQRSYQVNFGLVFPATSVSVNGNALKFIEISQVLDNYENVDFYTYDPSTLSVLVNLGNDYPVTSAVTVKVAFGGDNTNPNLQSGFARKISRAQSCKDLLDNDWGTYYPQDYPSLLAVADVGLNTPYTDVAVTLANFNTLFNAAVREVQALRGGADRDTCVQWLTTA